MQVLQWRRLRGAERRVGTVDDAFQVFPRDLGGRNVKRQDLECQLGEGEILPTLPLAGVGDLLWDIQATIGGEALQNDLLEGELRWIPGQHREAWGALVRSWVRTS